MRSKVSYFSISKPLIIENLRRFWAIPVLSFLVYFLSGVFPILMTYNKINNISGYIELSLNNQQPFYMFAHLLFPIVTAIVIFKYLQGISSVSVMHAMPFTRMKLYNSSILSGLILVLTPILLNGIILLAISKPAFNQYATESGLLVNKVNLFARADILNWIWVSVVMVLVIYAVSIFAGIVTGNSLMHFAMSGFFNFIVPGLYGIFIAYFSRFLFGFNAAGDWIDFAFKISPFTNAIANAGEFGIGVTIFYILSFILLIGLSAFLYIKRKLEHATDSLVFGFMEPIICYLIAFLGMTMLGFYFDVLGESQFYMYAGLVAGTIIFFIIGQMIVKKTPRIFNKKSFQSFAIYSLIAIVFIVSLNMDITGFEKRVPKVEKVDGFVLTEYFESYNRYDSQRYRDNKTLEFKDEDNIKSMIALHQSFVNNKDRFENPLRSQSTNVSLEYNPDSIFSTNRTYNIDYEFFRDSPEFKKIYESKEYKDFYSLKTLNYEKLKSIVINGDSPYSNAVEVKSSEEIVQLMDALEKDFQSQTFEDMVSYKHSYANIGINFTYKDLDSDTPERILDGSISHKVTHSYDNTIKWLEEHGYADGLAQTASQVQYVEIYHHITEDNGQQTGTVETASQDMIQKGLMGTGKFLKVEDPAKIQSLLDSYETTNINYDDYYYGVIVYKDPSLNLENQDYYNEKYYEERGDYYTTHIYFNQGNIQDFILEYFK